MSYRKSWFYRTVRTQRLRYNMWLAGEPGKAGTAGCFGMQTHTGLERSMAIMIEMNNDNVAGIQLALNGLVKRKNKKDRELSAYIVNTRRRLEAVMLATGGDAGAIRNDPMYRAFKVEFRNRDAEIVDLGKKIHAKEKQLNTMTEQNDTLHEAIEAMQASNFEYDITDAMNIVTSHISQQPIQSTEARTEATEEMKQALRDQNPDQAVDEASRFDDSEDARLIKMLFSARPAEPARGVLEEEQTLYGGDLFLEAHAPRAQTQGKSTPGRAKSSAIFDAAD